MCSKSAKLFSLVVFTDNSNACNILPHDSINLGKHSTIGSIIIDEKSIPLRIVKTSDNLDYLKSLLKYKETLKEQNVCESQIEIDNSPKNNKITEKKVKEKVNKEQEMYPYLIQTDKIELVSGSNVWICEKDLTFIKDTFLTLKSAGYRRKVVRSLLEKLIGIENMKFMYIRGTKNTKSLPTVVYSTIEKFLEQNAKNEVEHFNYKNLIQSLLAEARLFVTYKTLIVSDAEIKIDNKSKKKGLKNPGLKVFPYKKGGKNKVELLPQSDVFIGEDNLNFVNEICKVAYVDEKKLIFYLLTTLLGSENIKYETVNDETCIQIPEDVYFTVFNFVNGKLGRDCLFSEEEFGNCIQMIYKFSQQVVSGKSQINETVSQNDSTDPISITMSDNLEKLFETACSKQPELQFPVYEDISSASSAENLPPKETDYLDDMELENLDIFSIAATVIENGKRKRSFNDKEDAVFPDSYKRQKIYASSLDFQDEEQNLISQVENSRESGYETYYYIPPNFDFVLSEL